MRVLRYQSYHLLFLGLLLAGCYVVIRNDSGFLQGSLFGITTQWWLIIALLSPILHQIFVLFAWRYELYHQTLSKNWGKKAFPLFKLVFAVLILSRVVTLCFLAIANQKSLEISALITYPLSAICILGSGYLFYSVANYFGMDRAFGIDHFQPEEASKWPLVTQGIFKYTHNGMYVYGFLLLYIPGLLLASKAALLLAVFNHLYIWVHYYFTELPDMKEIYKN